MSDPSEMHARHAAVLRRLAEAGERLAMKHMDRALATDDPDIEVRATAAFHQVARSVRQCLALEAKLLRDAAQAARDEDKHTQSETAARRLRRREHARVAVERLIWTEAEGRTEAERLESELDDLLELEDFSDSFANDPIETVIARLAHSLGLSAPGEGPAATAPDDQAPSQRRSSA